MYPKRIHVTGKKNQKKKQEYTKFLRHTKVAMERSSFFKNELSYQTVLDKFKYVITFHFRIQKDTKVRNST